MFAYCLNNPIVFADRTGAMVAAATITAAGASAVSLGPVGIAIAIALIVVVVVATVPPILKSPARTTTTTATTTANTTAEEWLGEQKKGIEEKLTVSIAKANPPQSDKYHVHHIVAQSDRRAAPARYILNLVNISVNSIINLVLVKDTVHQRLHTTWYFNTVNYLIMGAYSSAGLDQAMQFKNVTNALISLQVYITSLNAFAP